MGHGYGLNHSRLEGSTDDYTDPFDVMSNMTDQATAHPLYMEAQIQMVRPYSELDPGLMLPI
jgi:hypothetical protein